MNLITLRKTRNSKILNKKRQPKWFDSSLFNLQRRLDDEEKLLKQYSKDTLVRGSYFSLLKIYRKTRKKKLKDFRIRYILKKTIQVNIGPYIKLLI